MRQHQLPPDAVVFEFVMKRIVNFEGSLDQSKSSESETNPVAWNESLSRHHESSTGKPLNAVEIPKRVGDAD